jgi:hypothetical protein
VNPSVRRVIARDYRNTVSVIRNAFWFSLFMIIMYVGVIYSPCASHVTSEARYSAQVTIIHY